MAPEPEAKQFRCCPGREQARERVYGVLCYGTIVPGYGTIQRLIEAGWDGFACFGGEMAV